MSTLISLSHKCEKYVATPVSWGLNTKTQRESMQLSLYAWFGKWLWKASIGVIGSYVIAVSDSDAEDDLTFFLILIFFH